MSIFNRNRTQSWSPASLYANPVAFSLGCVLEHPYVQTIPQTSYLSISKNSTQAQAFFKAPQETPMGNQTRDSLSYKKFATCVGQKRGHW